GTLIPGEAGSILVINRQGKQIGTLSDPNLLDGPWDLTILDQGNSAKVFVSNVLNGTVTRLDLAVRGSALGVTNKLTIAFGYAFLGRIPPRSSWVRLGWLTMRWGTFFTSRRQATTRFSRSCMPERTC